MWPNVSWACLYLCVALSFLALLAIITVILIGYTKISEFISDRRNKGENRREAFKYRVAFIGAFTVDTNLKIHNPFCFKEVKGNFSICQKRRSN